MWLIIKIILTMFRGYNMVKCDNEEWDKNSKLVERFFINTDFYTRYIDMVGDMLIWHKRR